MRHQIAKTRGDLGQQNLLGQLARQFGEAIGLRGALRSAIDQAEPDPMLLDRTQEPHARGAILVAAVFDAFLSIYKSRIADLLRLVTGSAAASPESDLHPDLLNRLVGEANKSATHVLRMCIRALDYCPPADINFGDYLRALVTADEDLVPDDDRGYRIALIEAFRRRGIYPSDCRSLAIDSLRWRAPALEVPTKDAKRLQLGMPPDREEVWRRDRRNQYLVWQWLKEHCAGPTYERELGLALGPDAPSSIERSARDGLPKLEVHSVRPARRVGPDGQHFAEIVVEITQSRNGYRSAEEQKAAEARSADQQPTPSFKLRGGCTLLVDMSTGGVRYAIRKDIRSEGRMQRQRDFLFGGTEATLGATYFSAFARRAEPFALLHRGF